MQESHSMVNWTALKLLALSFGSTDEIRNAVA